MGMASGAGVIVEVYTGLIYLFFVQSVTACVSLKQLIKQFSLIFGVRIFNVAIVLSAIVVKTKRVNCLIRINDLL